MVYLSIPWLQYIQITKKSIIGETCSKVSAWCLFKCNYITLPTLYIVYLNCLDYILQVKTTFGGSFIFKGVISKFRNFLYYWSDLT